LKYFKEKDHKYKKLAMHGMIYQENSLNKYLIDIPNFSQYLRETLLPLLQSTKEILKATLSLIS